METQRPPAVVILPDRLYVVCTGTKILDLVRQEEDLSRPWVPLIPNAHGELVNAIPGHLFVEQHLWVGLAARAQPHHHVKLASSSSGTPHHVYAHELQRMQDRIDDEADLQELAGKRRAAFKMFERGRRVYITHGPMRGMHGIVERVRGDNVRLLAGDKFITINSIFLAYS